MHDLKYPWFFLITLGLTACSPLKVVVAVSKSSSHFIQLKNQPEVRYEQGAKANANKVAKHYIRAIYQVEKRQYGRFLTPAIVHVTASLESYESYCLSSRSSGCVLANRLFLSPRLFKESNKIYPILVHELSHLHLDQYIGKNNSQLKVPSWFTEGLATFVSGGGGASSVSRSEAKLALRTGDRMQPNGKGGLTKKSGKDYGLSNHMFYRQSEMFVAWLYSKGDFKQLLASLRQGMTVEQALRKDYGFGVNVAWGNFLKSL